MPLYHILGYKWILMAESSKYNAWVGVAINRIIIKATIVIKRTLMNDLF